MPAVWDAVQQLPMFVAAGLLLNITPGADMALVARASAAQGWRAGAAAALGVGAGCWVHIAVAATGLGALMAGTPMAFAGLRWLGAAYLVWLGLGLWRAAGPLRQAAGAPHPEPAWPGHALPLRRHFRQGFLTNALNPKVALFFLAFVPQFIRPDATQQALAFVLLGTVFVVNSTLVNIGLAVAVAAISRQLGRQARWQGLGRWLNRGVGAVFVALGLRLAWSGGRA